MLHLWRYIKKIVNDYIDWVARENGKISPSKRLDCCDLNRRPINKNAEK
jgi:hypothetical protein